MFFDLEKAYDTTWRHGVIKQLQNMEVKGNMICFVRSFLSDRSIKVRVGNTLSSPFKWEEGVPQGSVLSVICFAVAINSVISEIYSPVRASLFVDDLAIYCTAYDAESACRYIIIIIIIWCFILCEHQFFYKNSLALSTNQNKSHNITIYILH